MEGEEIYVIARPLFDVTDNITGPGIHLIKHCPFDLIHGKHAHAPSDRFGSGPGEREELMT
jgi:hypothetical protein